MKVRWKKPAPFDRRIQSAVVSGVDVTVRPRSDNAAWLALVSWNGLDWGVTVETERRAKRAAVALAQALGGRSWREYFESIEEPKRVAVDAVMIEGK